MDKTLENMNNEFSKDTPKSKGGKLAVLLLGNSAPGGNNIIDGLLKFQLNRKSVQIVGYINGVIGMENDKIHTITEESFAPYRNLGGYDYLGRSSEALEPEQFPVLAESCKKHGITGLVLVGATHTLTDGSRLTEYFLENKISTRVVVVPATLDGNIRHQFL
jgi:6-phosphofructokinase